MQSLRTPVLTRHAYFVYATRISLVAKAGNLSLAVFIMRPQAEIKSAQALR